MTKRVLVTGATGFIGRHTLAPLKKRGYEVHALYHDELLHTPDVHWHNIDLLRDDSAKTLCEGIRPSHLLHFAWIAEPGIYWTSPENTAWKTATLGLLRAFADAGGTRVTMAGTCAEYDWSVPRDAFSESSPLGGTGLYGTTKRETYEVAKRTASESGISFAWGRIFYLYGPHEPRTRLVPSVINALLAGKEALCTSGEQIKDFLYVEDVADAFTALMESSTEDAVNIGSGMSVTVKDVILTIADILQKKDLVRLGARPAPPSEPLRLVADTRRLSREVGWQPRYSLQEGLETTIQWWKANTVRDR